MEQLLEFDGTQLDWGYRNGLYMSADKIQSFRDSCPSTARWPHSVFAVTGTMGVAFGLVPIVGKDGGAAVMMRAPDEISPQHKTFVVGGSLREFLGLGCVHGFAGLKKIALGQMSSVVKQYCQPANEDDDDFDIYYEFRAELDLEPWSDVAGRLEELRNVSVPR
jgi:hypothetical protein